MPVDVLHRALDARFSSVIGVARDQIPAGEGRPHGQDAEFRAAHALHLAAAG